LQEIDHVEDIEIDEMMLLKMGPKESRWKNTGRINLAQDRANR
jgi:hypothetical protein